MAMRLRTLGRLELLDTDFRRPKALLLLAYLAVEGPKDRHFLAELFWPSAANRRNSLAKVLSQLRREAPGACDLRDDRVHLALETDVGQLLEAIDERDAMGALELYRAPFLEHFYLANVGVELEEWVFATREFIAGGIRSLLVELALHRAARGRVAEATALAEAACDVAAAPPLDPHEIERLYPLLAVGNSPLTGRLRAEGEAFELDLPGSAEAVGGRLGQGPNRPLPGMGLPTRGTAFIGRELEVAEISTMLQKDACRLVTILGPGGAGKTRLAVEVARQQLEAGRFSDGVAFVTLEALSDADAIPVRIVEALGLGLQGGDTPLAQVLGYLGERQLLLVFDNFEHLLGGSVLIDELLAACPQVMCLVTSRERLHLAGEWLFSLDGLIHPTDRTVAVDRARDYDAVKLFLDRARQTRNDFELGAGNWPGVADICELVEGLPLALELAASWVRVMPPQDIADEIRRSVDILSADTRNLPPRHRSVRATFEYSWNLLEPKEQAVFRKLAVFSGGFTREAAREVSGADIPSLTSLIDKALLRPWANGRFSRHTLLAQFTREKLSAHAEEDRGVRARHAGYFASWAERALGQLIDGQQAQWLERYELEHDNLRTALDWSVANEEAELALRLCVAVGPFWRRRAHFAEGREWLEKALSLPGVAALPVLRARALVFAGDMARRLENYGAALSLYEESLAILEDLGATEELGSALTAVGIIAAEHGDYATARARFEASLAIDRQQGRRSGVAVALGNLATIAELQGDYPAARSLNERSLRIKRELGDESGMAVSFSNLGLIATYQGDYDAARSFLERCLRIERRLEAKENIVHTLSYLGVVDQRQGDYAAALAWHYQGLTLAREIGDKAGIAQMLQQLGSVASERGDHSEARVLQEQSLAIGRELGNRRGIAASLGQLGVIAMYRGDYPEALSLQQQSLDLSREMGDRSAVARSLQHLGRVAAERADYAAARSQLEESLTLRRQLGDRHELAASLAELGLLERYQQRFDAARERFEACLAIWRDLGNRQGVASLLGGLAGLEFSLGRPEPAARLWGAAEALRETIDVPLQPFERGRYDRDVAAARAQAGADRFASAWREGRAVSVEQAMDTVGLSADRR